MGGEDLSLNKNDIHNSYKGMRWLKCDLHMHTPADSRHWQGEKLIVGKEIDAAKAFAQACYEKGLDVVGITDHNLLSKNFISYLRKAFEDLEKDYKYKITLFPGFEFEADVGKGMHVICLFEPDVDVNEIDHILTECGVLGQRVVGNKFTKSTKRLTDILRIVQKGNDNDSWRGIVIIPHVFEDSLFDNDRISEWLQQEEYCNPQLLAAEVPKPVSQMSEGFQKLFRSGYDCHDDWKRMRPIATLLSSDNKCLIKSDERGEPTPNSIGYRYSWIKMSKPSIESLRQAFLDNESRVMLPECCTEDVHPAKRESLAKIRSIKINNVAFLSDQEVHFSPNLNCVIGGRGSGKSMLLEYLRIALGKDCISELDIGTKDRIERVKSTLNKQNATLELVWKTADGAEDHMLWQDNGLIVQNRELSDSKTFFRNIPVSFYSQQQLNTITESKIGERTEQANRLLEVIDGFAKKDLEELAGIENKLKTKIMESFEGYRKVENMEGILNQLNQEFQDLDHQWKAHNEIQEFANRHNLLKLESRYIENVYGEPGNQIDNIIEVVKSFLDSHNSFNLEDSPHAEWLRQFDKNVIEAKKDLVDGISQNIEKFKQEIETMKSDNHEWLAIKKELDEANEEFEKACVKKGLTVDDIGHLQEIDQSRDKKQQEVDRMVNEIEQFKRNIEATEPLLNQLHTIWAIQYQKRDEAARRANELAILEKGNQRLLEVTTLYQQDRNSFIILWEGFAPTDGRTRLGRNWPDLGDKLFKLFINSEEAMSPWQLLHYWLINKQPISDKLLNSFSKDLNEHLINNLEAWESLRCSRVHDYVDVKLYRADGSLAGSIAEGSLSDGQRNTVALALLLAQDGGPLVIDQPEDELDSNFIFKELIPVLRKVKFSRQLIMSTHNANLPVNGDAELVYALEVKNGHGVIRANGGLDQLEVTNAVLDIMEGTEEAFRRRREKYRF